MTPPRAAWKSMLCLALTLGCASSSSSGKSGGAGTTAGSGLAGKTGGQGQGQGQGDGGGGGGGAGGGAAAGSSGGGGAAGSGGAPGGMAIDPGIDPGADFGASVHVFDPTMPMADIQAQIDAVYATQYTGQFVATRHAFLFRPGRYTLDVKVGYYTQVIGLGASPDDVAITGSIRSMGNATGNATISFWRACENATVSPTPPPTPTLVTIPPQTNIWAVSQGASFRRMHIRGNLLLADMGNSSGGFISDSKIDGAATSGSQQQYFTRNTEWLGWGGGVWNMVFVGVVSPPAGAWPALPYTAVTSTPLVQEKPFLTLDAGGKYVVMVPTLRKDARGASWTAGTTPATAVPIEQFYVARAGTDTAATMNDALAHGKHLLLAPGVFHLDDSVQVTRPGTIVMGLGLATLAADKGAPAITVADVDGVKLAGFIVDAGPASAATLIQIGAAGGAGAAVSHAVAPTWLYDLTCRVGGGQPGTVASCLTIDSNDVVGDNLWLWRADHGMGVGWASNVSQTGLIVNGKNVTMYGLFVEHFQEFQTLWNGDGGRVYFYQSEMPYDPPAQAMWTHGAVNGYASYKVADTVTTHEAWGLGAYSAFRNNVVLDNAFETPPALATALHHLVTVWLSGVATTAINHVINGTGAAATMANRKATAN